MLISIIIPAYNEEAYLPQTLINLKKAISSLPDEKFFFEIIVCDNNSTDNTAKVAESGGAKVIFESVNQISRARNTGASIAKGNWLIFLDADAYPSAYLLSKVLERIETQKYIGCGTTVQVEGGSLFNKLRMERLNPLFRFFKLCGGVFIACEAEAFHIIEGFSNDLFAYEEFDFVFRLKRYGRQLGKRFSVIHKYPIITSGRKGNLKSSEVGRAITSNFAAIFLFFLYYMLPLTLFRKINKTGMAYWYGSRG